ncbi:LysR family transcriptional regulator [Mesorhizobium sp. BAC0120]|uniref:LysR family transcriptional regulator n=1 Tax=Mesorhizobium sp. BAC0120 TaxID=3090670 RepID=UPI00298BF25C|nr:LysR family transcriptional regulator [Mesorhizobium sp. BAC0120]MDW6025780.1 LysR family transcriptional regulator [Mesorhizobium sp. BAC0120]
MSELEDLRSFVEVVESGGFNRAAKRLGVSKSIVSRRIARMESELGTRLLSRTTRGISPTEAGLEFKLRSERILAEFDEAREAVAQQAGEVAGRLRLSVPLSFGVRHIAPVLAELAKHHPRLELDVSYSDRLVDLIAERFDVAVRIGRLRDSSLVARRIAPVRSVVIASPDYLGRKGRPSAPGDLMGHDCLIYTGGIASDWQFRSGKRTISVRPNGRLRSDSGEAIMQWAIAGLGIAEVPTFIASDAIESGALEPLLSDYPTLEYGVYAVRPPGSYVPGKVRILIDTLVERFAGLPRWDRCLMASHELQASAKG